MTRVREGRAGWEMRRKDKREVKGTEWGWLGRVERGWHVECNMDPLLHPTWERKRKD